ncbi:MAG TPA: hypothetical protein PK095_18725, partial [Myxococcota bacterium]|nr:hypothetical protein [Myxococcota bacterium]
QPEDGQGLDSAGWFFTMEHVDGRPFNDFLRPEKGPGQAHPSLTLSRRMAVSRALGRGPSEGASRSPDARHAPALEETEDPPELG